MKVFSATFYTTLHDEKGRYRPVPMYTEGDMEPSLFEYKRLIIPCHLINHWVRDLPRL